MLFSSAPASFANSLLRRMRLERGWGGNGVPREPHYSATGIIWDQYVMSFPHIPVAVGTLLAPQTHINSQTYPEVWHEKPIFNAQKGLSLI
jgi:hypothetical protein